MDSATLAAWVDGYVRAWRTNEPDAIARLFAADATYATGPFDEPWRGRAAIVAGWLGRRDEPGSWTFRYEVLATSPDGGVARGWATYPERREEFSNIWLIALDEQGQCTAFTEWWVQRPAREAASEGASGAPPAA